LQKVFYKAKINSKLVKKMEEEAAEVQIPTPSRSTHRASIGSRLESIKNAFRTF
jgi:hypothetical protein